MKRTALAVAIAAICAGVSFNALAEEQEQATTGGSNEQQETSGAAAQGAQGAQSQTSTEDDTDGSDVQSGDTDTDTDTDTDMDTGSATESDGETDMDSADSEGQMSGEQGATADNDAMGDDATDEAEGQMAQPTDSDDATAAEATTSAEAVSPDDDETTGDASGQMGDGNEGRTTNALEDPDNREPDESLAENDTQGGLMSLTISDVEGMTVVNQQGEDIGDVDRVVEHNDSGDLYAIVSIGGFWGFGATDVALAMQEMTLEEDQLVMQTTYGSDEIESATEEYNEDNYTRVDGTMQVGEVANHPNRGE